MNLDESTKLDFGVAITGADGKPDARFVIEGKDFSVSFPCTPTNEGVEAEIKGLNKIFSAGTYNVKLEIVLENKIYTPLIDKIEFEPSISITTESKVVKPIKESVKVGLVTVKKPVISEEQKLQNEIAGTIAELLEYKVKTGTVPVETINSALISANELSEETKEQLFELLQVAESIGIKFDSSLVPQVVQEEVVVVVEKKNDDGFSDEILDKLVSNVKSWQDVTEVFDFALLDQDDDILDNFQESFDKSLTKAEHIKTTMALYESRGIKPRLVIESSTKSELNAKAKLLAEMLIAKQIGKKPLELLSESEIAHVDLVIKSKPSVINRLSLSLLSKLKSIEKQVGTR